MTQAQQTQYEKALAKAIIEDLHIAGRGIIKATGQVFYAVTSSDKAGCYSVIVCGHALVCNCKAGQAGQYCKHRALVRCEMERTAAALAAQAATIQEDRAAWLPVQASQGMRLYR